MNRHKTMCSELFKRITAVIQELRIIQIETEELFQSINEKEKDIDINTSDNYSEDKE